MTQKPVIGVTTQVNLTPQGLPQVRVMHPYITALVRAGAAPVLLPAHGDPAVWASWYPALDGVLFTGGGDIIPAAYGGQAHPRVNGEESERDAMEFWLLQACLRDGKPFLGICRGLQVINVGMGGTLYEDIASQKEGALKHDYYPDWPRDHLAHTVRLDASGWLAPLTGKDKLSVNSLHHQGIRRLADGLQAVAWAEDGLVEAVEAREHPYGKAVQWHPEWLAAADPDMQAIFDDFVAAVRAA